MILKFNNWGEFCMILKVGYWMNRVTGNPDIIDGLIKLLEQHEVNLDDRIEETRKKMIRR